MSVNCYIIYKKNVTALLHKGETIMKKIAFNDKKGTAEIRIV